MQKGDMQFITNRFIKFITDLIRQTFEINKTNRRFKLVFYES